MRQGELFDPTVFTDAAKRRTGYKVAESVGYHATERWKPHCYQHLLRLEKHEGVPPLGLAGAVVREIPYDEARDFILEFEWLGIMGVTQFSYGLFLEGVLSGVLCFGTHGGTGALAEPFGKDWESHGTILVRGACAPWAHEHSASFLIGKVRPLLRKRGHRFVIAYSDPEAGEIGTVYQATNWHFYGLTRPSKFLVRPDGRRVDLRMVYNRARQRGVTTTQQMTRYHEEGYTTESGSRKLKYLLLTGDRRENRELMRHCRVTFRPYLKRCDDMRQVYAQHGEGDTSAV
jgi:hypothetical protein